MNNIELHNKIDELLRAGVQACIPDVLRSVICTTSDARRYFFARADATWFDWLVVNGFLDVVKQPSENIASISFKTSELDYLIRVAENGQMQHKVVDFMLTLEVSDTSFNPETLSRFLWICSKLSAAPLERMVAKIRDDHWGRLMHPFSTWGFEYKSMFETLSNDGRSDAVIVLAAAILEVRTDKVVEGRYGNDNPFYIHDISHCDVFTHLCDVDDAHVEKAFALLTRTYGSVMSLGGATDDGVFAVGDKFSQYDLNLFDLEADEKGFRSSGSDGVRTMVIAVTKIAQKLFSNACNDVAELRRLFDAYIKPLPDTISTWKLKLFVWTRCLNGFANDLRSAYRRIFEVEKLWPLMNGAEFEEAIRIGFTLFTPEEQREYVSKVLELEREYGHGILSSIYSDLTDEERNRAREVFGVPLDENFKPHSSVVHGYAGTVRPQAPPSTEDVWEKPIPEIVDKLKGEWSPKSIHEAYSRSRQDFLLPINAEGVGGKLQASIKARFSEYLTHASLFFDRGSLDAHYTYSFLRGVQDALKDNRTIAPSLDWTSVIKMATDIAKSGESDPFDYAVTDRKSYDSWLVSWLGVHSALADVVQDLLNEDDGSAVIDLDENRDALFRIVHYLLSSPDPWPEREIGENAVLTERSNESGSYEASNPFSIAINTTRGRAFRAFLSFVYQDGKRYPDNSSSSVSPDVKELYESFVEKENTRALMFMVGHYFYFFYFRDKKWAETLVPRIFTHDGGKADLYLAAWEGYLANGIYEELFELLSEQYIRAIKLDKSQYTKRKYFRDLDEALADHLALAYIYFEKVNLDSDIIKLFWSTPSPKRHKEFISFIGRHVISNSEEWKEKSSGKKIIKRLECLWDWTIKSNLGSDVMQGFDFWMKTEKNIFDPLWLADRIDRTLEKTQGDIDWEMGLMDSLPDLAKAAPEKALSILRRHLIDGTILKRAHGYVQLDIEIIRGLYKNPITRDSTYDLINQLLPLANGKFWYLRDVVNEETTI